MEKKIGRNDPCPCGSGKKYKQCCMQHPTATGKKKFTAKIISGGVKKAPDLMERTFGTAVAAPESQEKPPVPPRNFTASTKPPKGKE